MLDTLLQCISPPFLTSSWICENPFRITNLSTSPTSITSTPFPTNSSLTTAYTTDSTSSRRFDGSSDSNTDALLIYTSRSASSTSPAVTSSRQCTFACACASRSVASSCLAVIDVSSPFFSAVRASICRLFTYVSAMYAISSAGTKGSCRFACVSRRFLRLLQRCTRGESLEARRRLALRSLRSCARTRCARRARGPARGSACPACEAAPRTATRMRKSRSKRENSAVGRLMFSPGVFLGLYRPNRGFAAHSSDTRAFSVVWMPALLSDTVCCSITYPGGIPQTRPRGSTSDRLRSSYRTHRCSKFPYPPESARRPPLSARPCPGLASLPRLIPHWTTPCPTPRSSPRFQRSCTRHAAPRSRYTSEAATWPHRDRPSAGR